MGLLNCDFCGKESTPLFCFNTEDKIGSACISCYNEIDLEDANYFTPIDGQLEAVINGVEAEFNEHNIDLNIEHLNRLPPELEGTLKVRSECELVNEGIRDLEKGKEYRIGIKEDYEGLPRFTYIIVAGFVHGIVKKVYDQVYYETKEMEAESQ